MQHLVLNRRVECLCAVRVRVIVCTGGVDVPHLLIESLLRRAYLADFLEQLVEIVKAGCRFQPSVIDRKALHQILAEPIGGPLPELGPSRRSHPIAYRQNHLQVVVPD